MAIAHDLQKIGLSEKESRVYLATLELTQSSVHEIAKKSGINRTTAYVILDTLIKKGLASTIQKGKKTYYMAESPEILETIFTLQKNDLESKQKKLENIIPQLRTMYNQREEVPMVRFFEGKEGALAMIQAFHASKNKISRMIYPVDAVRTIFTEDERKIFKEKRIQSDVKTKVLYTFKKGIMESTSDGERIKISEKEFPIYSDIAFCDGKIRIVSLKKGKIKGIIIQDEDIYKTLVSLFDLAWEAARAREKKL